MARLSDFIIVIACFSLLLALGIKPILDYGNQQYGIANYNDSSLNSYNQLNDIQNQTEAIKEKTLNLRSGSGVTDLIGGFLQAGYDTIKLAFNSIGNFITITSQLFSDIPIHNGGIILSFIITIVALILLFLLVRYAVKDDI